VLFALLKEQDASDILVFGGGVMPDEDRDELLQQGIAEVFVPGGATLRTIEFLRQKFPNRP
jgi:methylmalonyl-CoA mutase C-terminal domain/subunit